ncbi:MAG: FecCD family ABC transporter permease [Sporolactobacillus sp.]
MKKTKVSVRRLWIVTLLLLIGLAIVFLLSLNLGFTRMSPWKVIQTLFGGGGAEDSLVLFHFRLPRMVIAMLCGAGIAVAGAILQSITRNDLSDPGILGINSGAGLAVVLYLYFFQGSTTGLAASSVFLLPIAAFAGALIAACLIYFVSWNQGTSPLRLILSGIGLNSAFLAIIIVFQMRMDPSDFTQATIWLSGSIWGSDWNYVLAVLPWTVLLIPLAISQAHKLNILALGDSVATGLGIRTERERIIFLLLSVALAGSSVSVGGGISFLGLIAPHITRRLVGAGHQRVLPISALLGALILLAADTLGRSIWAPSEIPVGLVVSAIGAPYFIYLLIKE